MLNLFTIRQCYDNLIGILLFFPNKNLDLGEMNQSSKSKYNSVLIKSIFILTATSCFLPIITAPIALVGGFLFTHFIGHPFQHLNKKTVSWLLKIAVVGLGFGMNIQETLAAGKDSLLLTMGSISIVLIAGYFIGKALNLQKETTHLISSGTAICGGSAIAAIAPIIKASEKDISISLGVIFLLNSVALLTFPTIGHFFNLTQHQFGLWSAIAIHDTSSVVGSALAYGSEALKVATTVKLARALWIIPLSLVTLFLFKGKNNTIKIPWFILLFIVAILLNSYLSIPNTITTSITSISKSLLVLTLFLVGAGLSFEKIKAAGWKPMILGISLWLIISVLSLIAIVLI